MDSIAERAAHIFLEGGGLGHKRGGQVQHGGGTDL